MAVETELYRIAQEALNNMLKHSAATRVTITIRYRHGTLAIQIKDNGKGFDPASVAGKGGMGLASIQERVERLGGTCQIISRLGRGTTVQVTLPRIESHSEETG